MRKLLFIACSLVLFGSAAMAQGKIDDKWHCAKPTAQQKMDVGDMPDHSYGIAQGACDATSSDPSFAEKSGAYTESQEMWKTTVSVKGHFMVTMDNGDKIHYSYTGSGSTDATKPMSNKWNIVSGTGKHKGIKGSGTCSGTSNADGSSDWACTGTYTMGAAMAMKSDKKM
jgi:hypothetical protein